MISIPQVPVFTIATNDSPPEAAATKKAQQENFFFLRDDVPLTRVVILPTSKRLARVRNSTSRRKK